MHGQKQRLEQNPHLASALAAVILGVVVLEAFGVYARSLEYRSIAALAANEAIIERDGPLAPVKNQGMALQQAALDTGCLLPIYGSSELNLLQAYTRPFHPTVLFRDRPTGFTIFPVGKAESTCLTILQKLASVGPALKGRKVAISLSPCWFYTRLTVRPDAYAGNFSDLHAGELVFESRLSLRLRHDAARRMLQFPKTVANRPLLRFALENLANDSPLSLACYDAVLPLGIMHNTILRYQDHLAVVFYLLQHPVKTSSASSLRSDFPLDWPALHRQADEVYRAHSNNNEFGLANEKWTDTIHQETLRLRNFRSEERFLSTLEKSREWVDLELLLRELNELGAQPLLLSMPIHGGWYDYCGVSSTARRAYYEKLRGISARYHVPVVDFADHDADPSFCRDPMGHLAPNGLLYYDQVLDGFFHGAIALQPELPVCAPSASQPAEAVLPIPPDARFPTTPGRSPRPVLHVHDSRQGAKDQLLNRFTREDKP
jgi:D-alanine transfer protein